MLNVPKNCVVWIIAIALGFLLEYLGVARQEAAFFYIYLAITPMYLYKYKEGVGETLMLQTVFWVGLWLASTAIVLFFTLVAWLILEVEFYTIFEIMTLPTCLWERNRKPEISPLD